MYNLLWSRSGLTPQKLGTFCEYYAKMTLASYGLDIFTSEVDDHGIDFVAESQNGFLKFQVKGVRTATTQYVFMKKEHFDIEDDSLFLFLILLKDGEHPEEYIIPTSAWRQESSMFVYHAYEGKKSKPEYGINLSKKNMAELENYRIENILAFNTMRPQKTVTKAEAKQAFHELRRQAADVPELSPEEINTEISKTRKI